MENEGMKFFVDLNERKESRFKKIMGALSVLLSVISFVSHYNKLSLFEAFFSIYFFLLGIIYYYEGTGESIFNTFGKRYIEITDENLKVKLSVFGSEKIFKWDKIKSINIGLTKIIISDYTGSFYKINLARIKYPVVVKLKELLSEKS